MSKALHIHLVASRQWRLALAAGAMFTLSPDGASAAAVHPARLPARLVTCLLGHATNFDPQKPQTPADITFDTHHHLSLYLPAINARTSPPPDAAEAAEPVDRRTRVIEDPDGITADAPGPFERVVDLWPERVELAKTTATGAFKTLLVSDYDPAAGSARMFLGTAGDLTSYDLKRIYMGDCTVALNPPRGRPKR